MLYGVYACVDRNGSSAGTYSSDPSYDMRHPEPVSDLQSLEDLFEDIVVRRSGAFRGLVNSKYDAPEPAFELVFQQDRLHFMCNLPGRTSIDAASRRRYIRMTRSPCIF